LGKLNRLKHPLVSLLPQLLAVSVSASSLRWEGGSGFRWTALNVRPSGKTGFTLLAPKETGILWTNTITEDSVAKHYNMVSGAGAAAGDCDGDGLCDLYFCNRGGENGFFRNLGNGKFENATATSDTGCAGRSSTGATFSDINGDGLPDLLVNSYFGTNSCFLNLGNGRFTNATRNAGLISRGGSTSLALGDVDGDGDLDLYVAYFGIEAILREGGRLSFNMVNGSPTVTGRHARRLKVIDGQLVELGEQDVLYLNDGTGHFTAANWAEFFRDEAGQPLSAAPMDFGLSVQIRDINEDGFPDIYVCNDFQTPDRAWLNDGHGRFRALPRVALRSMSYASMGVDFADIDRDGRLDFITVDMLSREPARRLRQLNSMPPAVRTIGAIEHQEAVPRNALYWNRGDGTYAEIAWFSGLAASDWSWAPIFLDVDLDGFEDLLVSTGSLYDVMDQDATAASRPAGPGVADSRKVLSLYPRLENRKAAFRNRGDLTFEDVSQAWGFDSRQVSNGMALADLDNDGDLDVVINCANAAPLIYRNDSSAPRVAMRLKGSPPNTQGIGAKIKFLGGAVPMQSQEMICGGRYLSGDQAMRVFAAGSLTNEMRIEVTWRSGRRTVVSDVKGNRLYEIDEPVAIKDRNPKSTEQNSTP
jgi:enediyne biosynthesis protein E4